MSFGGEILYNEAVFEPGVSHGRMKCDCKSGAGKIGGGIVEIWLGVGEAVKGARGGETPGGGGLGAAATLGSVGLVLGGVGLVKRSRFCARNVIGVW